MRFATVLHDDEPTLVDVEGEALHVLTLDGENVAPPLARLLADGSTARLTRRGDVVDPSEARWLPPLVPGKVCAVAINNRSFDAARISGPDHPAFFLKSPTSLVGHGEAIELYEDYGLVHPEPELAVVIGRRARRIPRDVVADHVFGYTILNDVTSVQMRNEDHFHFDFEMPDGRGGFKTVEQHTSYAGRYKSADTFGPIGPVVVSRDEIENADDLAMRCWLDDELVQSDRSSSYRYGVAQVVSFISHYETLLPGDVISLGTAVKIDDGPSRPLSSLDLRAGVRSVSVEIENIGRLTNTVSRL